MMEVRSQVQLETVVMNLRLGGNPAQPQARL